MKPYPISLADNTEPVSAGSLGQADVEALQFLAEKGYEVHLGLTPNYADDIITMAREPAIREYCPNDYGNRFADRVATERWLSKGRAVFLLLKRQGDQLQLAGYGWAGPATSEQVADGEATVALRLGEIGQGQGLATPFLQLMVASSAAHYGAKNLWLETWASNSAAVHVYQKLGFEPVAEVAGERQTQAGGAVADIRLYMSLPNERLLA